MLLKTINKKQKSERGIFKMNREKAVEMLENLREVTSDSLIVEHIIYHYLSADDAIEVLEYLARDYDIPLHELHGSYDEED